MVFMSRSTRRLTGSGSGFKASQKTGVGLKSHPTDLILPNMLSRFFNARHNMNIQYIRKAIRC